MIARAAQLKIDRGRLVFRRVGEVMNGIVYESAEFLSVFRLQAVLD